MKLICKKLVRPIALFATMTLASGGLTFAGTLNSLVSGTFLVAGLDTNGDAEQELLYFDGAGNFSGTATLNASGVISSFSDSGTYTVDTNGYLAAVDADGAITIGSVSADGNTFVGNNLTASRVPAIFVAIKQGQISQLNTAAGLRALFSITTGTQNSTFGEEALYSNTTASDNTAVGYMAGHGIQIGQNNAVLGSGALQAAEDQAANNGKGITYTTAIGAFALYSNTGGFDNIAVGADAMYSNTYGNSNVAVGNSALLKNLDGNANFALGTGALLNNIHGCYNVAVGPNALRNLNGAAPSSACETGAHGSNNIAIGLSAGSAIVTGSNNIDIGVPGLSSDNGVTRVGGIYGVAVSGTTIPVVVNSSGQLGIQPSSQRYKTDIAPMAPMSSKLGRLRPVTFHYKQDPSRTLQYGLIAEEVANVYSELVMRDEKGTILSVHYEELAPILLNEIQHQKMQLVAEAAHAAAQDARIRDLQKKLAEIQAGLVRLQAKDTLVAQR